MTSKISEFAMEYTERMGIVDFNGSQPTPFINALMLVEPPITEQVILIVLSAFIIIANIPVFIIIPRLSTLNTSAKVLMLNLAVVDIIIGIIPLTLFTYYTIQGTFLTFDPIFCKLIGFITCVTTFISIFSLTFLNLDKLLTLTYPLQYTIYITPKLIWFSLVALWVVSFLIFMFPVIEVGKVKMEFIPVLMVCLPNYADSLGFGISLFIISGVVPTIIILVSFRGIFLIAHRQNKRIAQQPLSSPGSIPLNDVKLVWMIILMTCGFYFMWSPYFITQLYKVYTGRSLNILLEKASIFLTAINSALNSIIYIPTMRSYRHELMTLIKTCLRKEERYPIVSMVRSTSGVQNTAIDESEL